MSSTATRAATTRGRSASRSRKRATSPRVIRRRRSATRSTLATSSGQSGGTPCRNSGSSEMIRREPTWSRRTPPWTAQYSETCPRVLTAVGDGILEKEACDRDEDFLNRIGGEAESLLGDHAEQRWSVGG